MRTLLAAAVAVLLAVVCFGPIDGTRPATDNAMPTLKKTAEEETYLKAVEAYQNGAVIYREEMESSYIGWGRAVCAKLDEGKDYELALTYAPGWPQDAFGRSAVTILCPQHVAKLPKLRS